MEKQIHLQDMAMMRFQMTTCIVVRWLPHVLKIQTLHTATQSHNGSQREDVGLGEHDANSDDRDGNGTEDAAGTSTILPREHAAADAAHMATSSWQLVFTM